MKGAFNGGLIGLIQLQWNKSIFQQTISKSAHSSTVGQKLPYVFLLVSFKRVIACLAGRALLEIAFLWQTMPSKHGLPAECLSEGPQNIFDAFLNMFAK